MKRRRRKKMKSPLNHPPLLSKKQDLNSNQDAARMRGTFLFYLC